MRRAIAVYAVAYLAAFLLRALTGSPGAGFALGLLVSVALGFQTSRSILLRIKKKDDSGRYADRVMTGTTLYPIVMAVSLPVCLVTIVGYTLIYALTL